MSSHKQILISGNPRIVSDRLAGAAFTPGHLLVGSSGKLIKHNVAGGAGLPFVAREVDYIGNNDGNASIDQDYALNDCVEALIPRTGDKVQMWLTTSQTISKDDALESNGDGTLKAVEESVADGKIIFYADEDLTTTTAAARIAVRKG